MSIPMKGVQPPQTLVDDDGNDEGGCYLHVSEVLLLHVALSRCIRIARGRMVLDNPDISIESIFSVPLVMKQIIDE